MYKKILIIILLIFLSGCGNGDETVRYPQNIVYQDYLITWNEVANSTSYSVKINDIVYVVDEGTSFSVDFLPNGIYDIRLKTNRNESSSYYSPALQVVITRDYEAFTSFTLVSDLISWSPLQDVTTYELYNDDQLLGTTSSSSFDLSTLTLSNNQLYYLKIGARYPTGDYVYSNTLLYHNYENLDLIIETSFNRQSVEDLSINLGSQMTIDYLLFNNQVIETNLYSITNDMLTLEHDAFHPDELGTHTLILLTPNGYITVIIDVIDPLNPIILSDDSIIYTTDVDMIFQFELNGGSFVGLSGNNITTSDYLFLDNELVIYALFIERILENNPSRETVILVYQLTKRSNIFMGFIFINIIPS